MSSNVETPALRLYMIKRRSKIELGTDGVIKSGMAKIKWIKIYVLVETLNFK